jgi:hypothetical protein
VPIIPSHVNPYCNFQLNLHSRLRIDPPHFGPQSIGTSFSSATIRSPYELLRLVTQMLGLPLIGGDLKQIKFLLGHSSIQTTERRPGILWVLIADLCDKVAINNIAKNHPGMYFTSAIHSCLTAFGQNL